MLTSVPWANSDCYPRPQALRDADLSNDDVLSYDLELMRAARDPERGLFTPRDCPYSVDVLDFCQDGLSGDEPRSREITNIDEFENCFLAPWSGFDSRFIVFKPAVPSSVSSSPLYVSEEITRKTLTTYQVMSAFLDCLHAYGEKYHDTDKYFSGAKHLLKLPTPALTPEPGCSSGTGEIPSFEVAYNFRFLYWGEYPETKLPTEIAGWRIRQTAVYHQYNGQKDLWVLVQPSKRVQNRIKENLKTRAASCSDSLTRGPLDLHLLFMSAAMTNWRHYFNCLEAEFLQDTSPAVNKAVGNRVEDETGGRSLHGRPARALKVNFRSVQNLQKFEETIQDFKACLQANQDILNMLLRFNSSLSKLPITRHHDHDAQFSWHHADSTLQTHIATAQAHLRSANMLVERIKGRRKLLYDILDYQHKEELNHQTGEQLNQYIKQERARAETERRECIRREKDANFKRTTMQETIGVRIMTIVALIYLPLTYTSSFLEAGIFSYDEKLRTNRPIIPHINVNKEFLCLYFVMASPLTLVTLGGWALWEWIQWKKLSKIVDSGDGNEEGGVQGVNAST